MLHAAVLLYTITGKEAHLAEAQRVAEASYDYFAPPVPAGPRFFPDENPWFTVVLFKGYRVLYGVDGDPTYIRAIQDNVSYAWAHARDADGLISPDWSGQTGVDEPKWLLDEACMVELYAEIAAWESEE